MNRLKEILSVLGLSQVEFARRTGLSEAAISQYISGEREPTTSSISAILSVIPCTYETLWPKAIVTTGDEMHYIQAQKRRHTTSEEKPNETREHFYGPDMPY